jgi:hypothetical protein
MGAFFQPKEWFNISDHDKFSGASWEKQLTISIFDYLPIYAKLPPNHKAPDFPEVLEGTVSFQEYYKGSNYQIGRMHVTDAAKLRIPLFYFPGMRMKLDGQEVSFDFNDCRDQEYCFGLINAYVPIGDHTLWIGLTNTPVRATANSITILSIAAYLYILFFKRKERWF